MPIDYTALGSEIRTDPMALGYAASVTAGSDTGVAALLNQRPGTFNPVKTWTASAPVLPLTKVLQWAAAGPLAAITAGQTTGGPGASTAIKSACMAAITLINGPFSSFDVSDPNNTGLISGLVAGGIITSTDQTNLLNLANVPASRAEVLFGVGTVINYGDVSKALGR